MDHHEILEVCKLENPDIIYLAIGCSMAHWSVGDMHDTPQSHPPPVKALGGRQICILIDPTLENPPRFTGITEPTMDAVIRTAEATYIPLRRCFDWDNGEKPLIDGLCKLALNTKTRLIVQDYAGNIINQHYPLATFGRTLLKKVLFDFTYQDGGCYIDFNNVHILTRLDGSFVQPIYEPMADVFHRMEASKRKFILKARTNTICYYVKRLHGIQSGTEEYRDWCTPDHVSRLMEPLCLIYGTPLYTDNPALEKLMLAYLNDLCQAVGDYMSDDDALRIARQPGKDYQEAVGLMQEVLLYQ